MSLKLIILDFDGTLGDTRTNIILTMQQTLAAEGFPERSEEEIAATIGLPLEDGIIQLVPGISQEELAHSAKTYRDIFEKNLKTIGPKPFPHVQETLAQLHGQGILLTVASSRGSASLNGLLRDMGIAPYISYVLGADNVTRAKPDPEPVLKTLKDLGVGADEALVVGDMPVDIRMGLGAGAKTCAVTYGNAPRADLEAAGADHIIDDFSDLSGIVDVPESNPSGKKEFWRFLKFVLFSASAGIVEIVSFTLLNECTGMRYWPCYLIALVLSVLWNFTFNRKFTFRSDASVPAAMLKVFAYYLVFTPLTTWLGDYLAETAHWNEYLVTALNMGLNLITEFLYQKYVVYRGKIDTTVK